MKTSIRVKTNVLADGRIELTGLALSPGDTVEVTVTPQPAQARRSAVDILAEAPGHRLFHSAEEVDAHVRAERDAWD